MKYSIGFDIGATYIRGAVISEYGNVVKLIKKETGKVSTQDDLINRILEIYSELGVSEYNPVGVGVGICGPVYPKDGSVYVLPNLGLHNVPLRQILEEKLQISVFVSNDANLAGLAEAKLGSGINYKIVQYITVSTGLGGGLIINGRIIEGRDGYAQEIGHMIIRRDTKERQNQTTNAGSWESCCSGTAIQRKAVAMGLEVPGAKEVFDLEQQGNPIAKKIVDEWIEDMAIAIANINLYIEPSIYVFGGGVSNSMTPYIERLRNAIGHYSLQGARGKINIAKARLGSNSGIIGAALQTFYLTGK